MQGFSYVWFLNLVGFADPFWKWISSCLSMVGCGGGADCEGEGYRVRGLLWIGGWDGMRHIPLIRATYIYFQTTIYRKFPDTTEFEKFQLN